MRNRILFALKARARPEKANFAPMCPYRGTGHCWGTWVLLSPCTLHVHPGLWTLALRTKFNDKS